MTILDDTLDVLRRLRPAARARGVELVGVVGSTARGDAGPDSDIDVVYSVIGPATLLGLGGLMSDLEDALGRRVDLIDLRSVRPRTRSRMERDLVVA